MTKAPTDSSLLQRYQSGHRSRGRLNTSFLPGLWLLNNSGSTCGLVPSEVPVHGFAGLCLLQPSTVPSVVCLEIPEFSNTSLIFLHPQLGWRVRSRDLTTLHQGSLNKIERGRVIIPCWLAVPHSGQAHSVSKCKALFHFLALLTDVLNAARNSTMSTFKFTLFHSLPGLIQTKSFCYSFFQNSILCGFKSCKWFPVLLRSDFPANVNPFQSPAENWMWIVCTHM